MAVVNILDAFTYKWAQLGTAEALTDDQWKVGWSFIGAVPPSVEQFNKWGQIFDEKSNYLYAQLNAIYALTGTVPSSSDGNSLRDALRGTNLFITQAAGTNDTRVATTAFVQANRGGLIRLTSSGTFVVPAGVTNPTISGVAGGGGGGGGAGGGTGNFVGGAGGAGGAGQSVVRQSYPVVPGSTLTITIGAGGTAGTSSIGAATGGGNGGNTVIAGMVGGTVTLIGGGGGAPGVNAVTLGTGGAPGTGYPQGQYGQDATNGSGSGGGGSGGSSPFGGGGGGGRGGGNPGASSAGTPAVGFGGGGGAGGGIYGGTAGAASGGAGGTGSAGLVIIEW